MHKTNKVKGRDIIQQPNLKGFGAKVAMKHSDDGRPFSVAYCIKYFINLIGVVYINLSMMLSTLN